MTAPLLSHVRRMPRAVSPVAAFERLYAGDDFAFLYESLESDGERGRYSFLGGRPRLRLTSRGEEIVLHTARGAQRRRGDLLETMRSLLADAPADLPAIGPFSGGLVGCFSYDVVRRFERLPAAPPDDLGDDDACFMLPDELIVCDHMRGETHIVLFGASADAARCERILAALTAPEPAPRRPAHDETLPPYTSNLTPGKFRQAVLRAKQHIAAGDIFQVVLSQRLSFDFAHSPLALFRALRETNPSPYMYLLRLGERSVVGSSPEVLVSLSAGRVITRPLAGTRPRGTDADRDAGLEAELRADPKETAEHVMLVDLARNDVGRVCEFGSVRVTRLMDVERYSRVMHLTSQVEGRLAPGFDALDLFRATFPAGTVSGAPKVRAMEIIDALEPTRRGLYAGAIGYFGHNGDMDLCIAIRTIVLRGGRATLQAGAGIVADSDPQREYEETLNKARAVLRAAAHAAAEAR